MRVFYVLWEHRLRLPRSGRRVSLIAFGTVDLRRPGKGVRMVLRGPDPTRGVRG